MCGQGGEDDAGFGHCGTCFGIDVEHSIHVPGQIEDDAGADGVAAHGRSPTACGHRHPVRMTVAQDGHDICGRPRKHHRLWRESVVGGVVGVFGEASSGIVGVDAEVAQVGRDAHRSLAEDCRECGCET